MTQETQNPQLTYSGGYNQPLFSRIWAMPNKLTFTIKPIKELVERNYN